MKTHFAVLLLFIAWLQCTNSLRSPRLWLRGFRRGDTADSLPQQSIILPTPLSQPKLYMSQQSIGRRRVDILGARFPVQSDYMSVSSALIAINVITYLLSSRNPAFKYKFMKINSRVARGEAYRLFSALFLHADLYHVMANSYSLAQMGPQIERYFGPVLFLLIYLGSGTLANLMTFLLRQSPYALGASGSTFGLMGAYATYIYLNTNTSGRASRAILKSLARTVCANLFYGLSVSNVDNAAHLGGIVAGAALAVLFGPRVQQMHPSPHRYVKWHQAGQVYLGKIVRQWTRRGVDAIRKILQWGLLR